MTIGKKIFSGFTVVLLVTAAVGMMAYYGLTGNGAKFRSYIQLADQGNIVANLQSALLIQDSTVKDYIISKDIKRFQEYEAYDRNSSKLVESAGKAIDKDEMSALLGRVVEAVKAYRTVLGQITKLNATEVEVVNGVILPKATEIERNLKFLFDKLQLENNVTGIVNASGATRKFLMGRYYVTQLQTNANPAFLEQGRSEFKQLDAMIATLETLLVGTPHETRIKTIKSAVAEYVAGFEQVQVALFSRSDLVNGALASNRDGMLKGLAQLRTALQAEQTQLQSDTQKSVANTSTMIAVFGFAGLGISVFLATMIVRSTGRALRGSALQLRLASEEVTGAANQIAGSSQSLAGAATQQAASVQSCNTTLQQIAHGAQQCVDVTKKATQVANRTRESASEGVSKMEQLSKAMAGIRQASVEVSGIVKTIEDIALQTNLLALNAAVEAARAGDSGRGFAVVAEEVRSLAQRSAASAQETAKKIAVSVKSCEDGVQASEGVNAQLQSINEGAAQVANLLAEVDQYTLEQSRQVVDASRAVDELGKTTQGNAATAEESAAASQELSAQTASLQQIASDLGKLVGGDNAQYDTTENPERGYESDYKAHSRLVANVPVSDYMTKTGVAVDLQDGSDHHVM